MAKAKEEKVDKFFSDKKAMFQALSRNAHLIGNRIGRRTSDDLRVRASWLFMRACVTAQSITRLFEPAPATFGGVYLDHPSIAILFRALIENVAVLLYVADTAIGRDEWICRMQLVDLQDFVNRQSFLNRLPNYKSKMEDPDKLFAELQDRLATNPFFKTLPAKAQKKFLEGEEMFLYGRHQAMLKLGWGEDLTRGIYKYLSNQAHSLAMAFHRTEFNKAYAQNATYPKVVVGFAAEFGCKALGIACLKMFELFPDTELAFDVTVLAAFKKEYTPS
jgi:hypothetical protein